jgi:hypothetical protein
VSSPRNSELQAPLSRKETIPAVELVVGGGKLDRRLENVEAFVDAYPTDDGLRYLDYRPLTPPDCMVPEDLAVTILISPRVAGTVFKAV